jgi:processive 1,2-diacylglycerol beta-glucosyltransferase
MKLKTILLVGALFFGSRAYGISSVPKVETQTAKKRIVVFTSKGGGGHTAVTRGLERYFTDDAIKDLYEITSVNIFQDVLAPFDTLRTITFGMMSGEDFYNFCLQCRWITITNNFAKVGRWSINFRQSTVEWLLLEFFRFEKPDLILSVIPLANGALINVAEKLNVPLLVVTNDLDTTNYINGIEAPIYRKFVYTLAFDDPHMKAKIAPAQIPPDQIRVTGFPLRPEFFKKKDRRALKKEFELPDHKPIVMILMGGAGSLANYRYVRALAAMDTPLHLIVCLGRNERLRKNISKVLLPAHISMTVLGFTDRIADLMAVSDVLITKPGPGSICEALESNLPMIVDQTSGTLWWETLNVEFVTKNGFGDIITNFKEVPGILNKYIKDPSYREKVRKTMKHFKRKRFDYEIRPLIKEMLAMQ